MDATVRALLEYAGRTYAHQAGITVKDTPAPLYQLLVLSVLVSTRIKADIAVDATRELIRSGYGTPQRMLDASWQQRVDALGRAHYVRYDESTATALGEGAQLALRRYRGDLRRLREAASRDPAEIHRLLREFQRLGPVGADIFCREAQDVWHELRPYLDGKALDGAKAVGLPHDPTELAKRVPDHELGRVAAALVRVSLDKKLAAKVRG